MQTLRRGAQSRGLVSDRMSTAAKPLKKPDLIALSKAIDDYEKNWKPVDRELYDLCLDRHPDHHDPADVYTKVAIVGRVYATGISRAWGRRHDYPPNTKIAKNRDRPAETVVKELLLARAKLIGDGLGRLKGRQFGREVAADIVALHGDVTHAVHAGSGLWLTSFVAKYLHFHCDIVPVYDDIARSELCSRICSRTANQVADESLPRVGSYIGLYRSFVARFIAFYERYEGACAAAGKPTPTVKELDHLLWQQSD